jgi:hypothetical protein
LAFACVFSDCVFNSVNVCSRMIFRIASYTHGPLLGLYSWFMKTKQLKINLYHICLLSPAFLLSEIQSIVFWICIRTTDYHKQD